MTQAANLSLPRTFLGKLSDSVNTACEAGLFATLALMTVVTILQIVCRMWFRALTWSEELTSFLLVFATFLGSAVAFKRGAHLAVGFLLDVLPSPVKKVALLAIEVLGIAFFAVVAWYGAMFAIQERMQMASSMPISMGWLYMVFPLTGAVTILHLTERVESLIRYGVPEKKKA